MTTRLHLALLALLALPTACGSGTEGPRTGDMPAEQAGALAGALPEAVREVRCGCKVPDVGACGNYVAVDGAWLAITNPADLGLGKMEWCAATETVEALVAGERVEGGIALSRLEPR